MIEIRGDLWDFAADQEWIVITTNGDVRHDGHAVMGRGVAREAAARWTDLPPLLGAQLRASGNRVFAFPRWRLLTYPVKHSWRDQRADLALIEVSAHELVAKVGLLRLRRVYLVRPGCGNGALDWPGEVRPLLTSLFDDRFHVVERSAPSPAPSPETAPSLTSAPPPTPSTSSSPSPPPSAAPTPPPSPTAAPPPSSRRRPPPSGSRLDALA